MNRACGTPGCFPLPKALPISLPFLYGHNHFSPKGCFSPLPAWQAVYHPKLDSSYSNQGFSLLAFSRFGATVAQSFSKTNLQ